MLKAPDGTFLYQIGLFLVVWFVLKRFWFEPAMKVIKERSKRSLGAVAEATAVQAEVARMRQEHATAMEQTRAEAQRDVQDILRKADAEQRRVVEEATAAAQETLTQARKTVAGEIAAARAELDAQVAVIAKQVASAVLGRSV